MLKKTVLSAAILATLIAGCGRGEYDKKVEGAINRAKNPAAENKPDEAGKKEDAAKDGEAKGDAAKADAPMGDAPKADAPVGESPKADGMN